MVNKEPQDKFFNACIANNVGAVKDMIEKNNVDINSRDSKGRTALHIAAEKGNLGVFETIAELKKKDTKFINARDN